MNEEEPLIEIEINLTKRTVESPEIIQSIEPDNDENIEVEYLEGSYIIKIKRVKLGSVSSLCLDILQSVELSKKLWEERI